MKKWPIQVKSWLDLAVKCKNDIFSSNYTKCDASWCEKDAFIRVARLFLPCNISFSISRLLVHSVTMDCVSSCVVFSLNTTTGGLSGLLQLLPVVVGRGGGLEGGSRFWRGNRHSLSFVKNNQITCKSKKSSKFWVRKQFLKILSLEML